MQEALITLGKKAEERRNEIEAKGNLPKDIAAALKQTGVLRLWVAKAYGGEEADLLALINAIQTLAYYNGSVAWVASVTGTGSLTSGYLQPDFAQEAFGAADAMLGGFAAPVGKAKRVDGGLLVNGRWGWGSGTANCSTVIGGIMIQGEKEQPPMPAVALFYPKDVEWHNTWQVNGLRGTGSGDYELKDIFVPDGRWIYFPVQKSVIDAPLYRVSFYGALAAGVSAVGLGFAKRALDEIKQLGLTKKPVMARKTLSEKAVVQFQLAEKEAKYQAAKAFLEKAATDNFEAAKTGIPDIHTKNLLRMAATHVVTASAEVVDWCYKIGGGSTIWNSVKLQELQRDMLVLTQHGLVAPSNNEMIGKVAFGLRFNPWLL